jgi:hypothetical protein
MTRTYQALTGSNGASSELVKSLQSIGRSIGGTTLLNDLNPIISSVGSNSAYLVTCADKAEQAV